MPYVHGFLIFWYNFIVGDDWTVAATVAVVLAVTYWLARHGTQVWWLLPAMVILITGVSIRRAVVQP
jgi:hypothetical protein